MDISKLRIGNLIMLNGKHHEVNIEDLVFLCKNKSNNYKLIKVDKELLIDFGFSKESNLDEDSISEEKFIIAIDKYTNLVLLSDFSFGLYDTRNKDIICFENDIIDTIDRLQNIYFDLSGKKLIKKTRT